MSETATHVAAAPEHATVLFSQEEVEQFGADDVTAGGAIGKMLSALFLYTVFAMGIAGWWTYSSIIADKEAAQNQQSSQGKVEDHDHGATQSDTNGD